VTTLNKSIKVRYFALLREERGLAEEIVETSAETLEGLYNELRARHKFGLGVERLRVAVKDAFVGFDTRLESVDSTSVVVFVPPVAGG
jgi:molybdopterin converting factor small subunit